MLCHGDLMVRHVLLDGANLVLCDFEESRYVVGALDDAMWLTHEILFKEGSKSVESARQIIRMIYSDFAWKISALAWMVVTIVNFGIWWNMQGIEGALNNSLKIATALIT
jgi:hypothetical protein